MRTRTDIEILNDEAVGKTSFTITGYGTDTLILHLPSTAPDKELVLEVSRTELLEAVARLSPRLSGSKLAIYNNITTHTEQD